MTDIWYSLAGIHVLFYDYNIVLGCYCYFHLVDLSIFCLFCFVLQHINLIGHLMLNQVQENNFEKKFKGEVLGINDEL